MSSFVYFGGFWSFLILLGYKIANLHISVGFSYISVKIYIIKLHFTLIKSYELSSKLADRENLVTLTIIFDSPLHNSLGETYDPHLSDD